ncbi:hypothetical protein I5677_13600 [Mobilitalea sibirica]|uniref:DUF4352 domain-containing protein n=1 Tax=Mobilitalea sibirica TaxID=1462919 RepID=A0A8J7HDD6_9FIRM|nr:hypothetical protein [Mobilitalea sibirica]MBH1941932.1 hypothetical protein [Mobilitalea sibirica]
MKKILTTVLCILILTLGLSGCGKDEAASPDNNGSNNANNTQDNVTGENNDVQDTTEDTEGVEDLAEQEDNTNIEVGIEIEEQVIFDQEGFKITALNIEDTFLGPEIRLLIENSSDTNITVQAKETSINDLMIEPAFSSNVAAGKKAKEGITFLSDDLKINEIETIANIEFILDIFNTETWDTIIESDPIIIHTSESETYVQEYDDTGEVIYEGNDIKIVEKGLMTDDFFGPVIKLYIENNSNTGVTVQARDVSVNGFMVEPAFSADVSPGKKANEGITFFDLEENQIDEITQAEFTLEIFDTITWDTIATTDTIQLEY